MHLADRRGGDRLGLELHEQALQRLTELLLDHLLGLCERKRRHVVLETAELDDDVGRQHVGPHRQQLPELDERRAELVEHLPQMLAALRREPVSVLAPAAPRHDAMGLEEVAEPVPGGDLEDLREPAEVPRGCFRHCAQV